MTSKKKATMKSTYKGILNEPIILPHPMLSTSEESDRIYQKGIFERLDALYEHYGVARGNTIGLILKLAQEHVPGFRSKIGNQKTAGRPAEYTGSSPNGLRLFALVRKHMIEKKLPTEREGVRSVFDSEVEYADFKEKKEDGYEHLYSRFLEVKKDNTLLAIIKGISLPPEQIDELIIETMLNNSAIQEHICPPRKTKKIKVPR